MPDATKLPTWTAAGLVHVVVETPAQSRMKYAYDDRLQHFVVSRPLALGIRYPYDWGFIPSTRAEDGDPLDALVLSTVASHPGIVYTCHPVGIIRITQRMSGGRRGRNDRVILVPHYGSAVVEEGIDDALDRTRRTELELFFLNAVTLEGKKVRIEGWDGAKAARKAIAACAVEKP